MTAARCPCDAGFADQCPIHAAPSSSGGELEKDVERRIIGELRKIGCDVYSTSQPFHPTITPGVPDLYVRHVAWGIAGWMEVKRPGGKGPTRHQRTFLDGERALGRMAGVVRSVSDALDLLEAHGAPLRR